MNNSHAAAGPLFRGGPVVLRPSSPALGHCKQLLALLRYAPTVAAMNHLTIPIAHITRLLTLERSAQGLSQDDLAAKLGVTRQQVSNLESASSDLRTSTLVAWAAALGLDLGISVGALFDRVVDERGTEVSPTVTSHVRVTGPGRHLVLDALRYAHPVPGLVTVGIPDRDHHYDELLALPAELDATMHHGGRRGVVMVECDGLDDRGFDAVTACLGRARAAGWVVIVCGDAGEHTALFEQNTALSLDVDADGVITTRDGARWLVARGPRR